MLQKASRNPALAPQLDWPRRLNIALDAAKVLESTLCALCDGVLMNTCKRSLSELCSFWAAFDLLGVAGSALPVPIVLATGTDSARVSFSKQTCGSQRALKL